MDRPVAWSRSHCCEPRINNRQLLQWIRILCTIPWYRHFGFNIFIRFNPDYTSSLAETGFCWKKPNPERSTANEHLSAQLTQQPHKARTPRDEGGQWHQGVNGWRGGGWELVVKYQGLTTNRSWVQSSPSRLQATLTYCVFMQLSLLTLVGWKMSGILSSVNYKDKALVTDIKEDSTVRYCQW